MSSISQVYGSNFQQSAAAARIEHTTKLLSTNISHKQFTFRNNNKDLFVKSNMVPQAVSMLIEQVSRLNPKLTLVHINKLSEDVNMLPYHINGPVEYFAALDASNAAKTGKAQAYFVYITPNLMEAY